MNSYEKEDKQNFRWGLYFYAGLVLCLATLYFFWDYDRSNALSCLTVRSNINSLIEQADNYKENGGITLTQKKGLLSALEKSFKYNRSLNCGIHEDVIRKEFNF